MLDRRLKNKEGHEEVGHLVGFLRRDTGICCPVGIKEQLWLVRWLWGCILSFNEDGFQRWERVSNIPPCDPKKRKDNCIGCTVHTHLKPCSDGRCHYSRLHGCIISLSKWCMQTMFIVVVAVFDVVVFVPIQCI